MRTTLTLSGLDFAVLQEGEGPPILLIHGFGSSLDVNWVGPGWVDTLVRAGRQVISFDNRGHGGSTKLYEPALYHAGLMAEDAARLLDHLGIERAPVMGYSMGARITAHLALARPDLVAGSILGGLGIHLVNGVGLPLSIAEAMEAPSRADIPDATGRMFRAFADTSGADRRALAACIRGSRQTLSPLEVREIAPPVLIAVGTRDTIAGSAQDLAGLIPGAEVLDIPGRDHNPAVGDKVYKAGVLDFLARHGI